MNRFFNTTLGISMLPDGQFKLKTLTIKEVKNWLQNNNFQNVANPNHANSLDAISRKISVDVRNAEGRRVSLSVGDECLVAQISGIPRETREFTDKEIKAATFTFRLVKIL